MVLAVMSRLRWVVAFVAMPLLLCTTHIVSPALLFRPPHLIEPPSLGRVTSVRLTGRSGRPTVMHIVQPCTILLVGLLLGGRGLFFPIPHSLRTHRRWSVVAPLHRSVNLHWWLRGMGRGCVHRTRRSRARFGVVTVRRRWRRSLLVLWIR